ncbi:MAG TPA: hypothetical protein VFD56_02635 [Chitinophagaceae bacterium]|nr:hypothetical protein [Chitinophagaceae bacterium]
MQYLKNSAKLVGILFFMLISLMVRAQEKIVIDKEEIGTWFERNWMWVAGGVVLVLLIAVLSRGNTSRLGSRRTTTVIKDEHGKTKSVVTSDEPVKLS